MRHLPEAHVVKAFNNINLGALPRPVGAADRTALPTAGNDPGAKKHAAALARWPAGPLAGWPAGPNPRWHEPACGHKPWRYGCRRDPG